MQTVHCVACAGPAAWEEGRDRYRCTACGLAFEASSASGVYEELPDLSEHLVTAPLPDLSEPESLDLEAPTWVPGRDVARDVPVDVTDDEPVVVWNLELDVTLSEGTTDAGQ